MKIAAGIVFAIALATDLTYPEGASALTVRKTIDVSASPDRVWAAIGDFCGIAKWHPLVASCAQHSKDGRKFRDIAFKDGGKVEEQIYDWNDEGHYYTYIVIETTLPVAHYTSTVAVMPKGGGSTILWTGRFEAKGEPDAKVVEEISALYESGLDLLKSELH